jgi:hypothetical protein
MRKEEIMAYFKALSQHLPGGIKETHENLGQDSQSLSSDSKLGPPKYETEVLTTQPQRLLERTYKLA